MGRTNARGFSLLETILAVAIAVVLGWLLFHMLAQVLLVSRIQAQRDLEQSAVTQLTDNLTTEEDDAWAIYTPPTDALGASNGDGHEVDFFARDGKQQPYFWAYNYDATAKTLTRYRFGSPGGTATKDLTYSGITTFYAHTYPLTALQDSSTPIYSTLYNGATLQNGIVHFYPGMPWIAGGNNITYVHFEGATIKRDLELVTQTAPSGFTIVLNYTPSPAPSPTPAPHAWPPAIVFAASGMTLADATVPQRVYVARLLNGLLGGGNAQAATACTAKPYNADSSGNPTTPLAAGSTDPYNSSYSVPSDGCWNSGAFVVTENGYTNAFGDNANGTCISGGNLFPGGWSPTSAAGPTAIQAFAAGQSAVSSCSVIFQDVNAKTATSYAAVLFPNPMYAEVTGWSTTWTYDCADKRAGKCINGGWQGSTTYWTYEYVSTDQGATWTTQANCPSSSTCPYPAQFVDTASDCTSDKVQGGNCPGPGWSKNSWAPYAPPNSAAMH